MNPKNPALLLLIILLSIFMGACDEKPKTANADNGTDKKADAAPAFGDTQVYGSIGDATNLLPALASDTGSTDITDLVYSGLLKIDKDLKLVGDLAERYEISEDGLTITFHLRRNVKWQDGHPVTAKDALFTYQLMADPKTPTPYGEDFKQVQKAEMVDEYTFRVTYPRAFAPALNTWAFKIMPAHLLEGKDITTSELARSPVGTGPYRFKSWTTQEKITLEANEEYFKGRPWVARQITRIIPDRATMFLELKSGGIDRMNLTPTQFARQTDTPDFKAVYSKYKFLSFSYTYLGFNLLDDKFKDKRVRQAISFAIDKNEIIQGVLLGLGKPASGPFKPGTWAYNPKVEPYPFDQEKAKKLLAEAGWRDEDGDGVLEKDGRPFEFTIMTNQGNKKREMTAVIIQRRLKDVGIRVKVRIIEWSAFLKEFVDKKKFEAVLLAWTLPVEPDPHDVWNSTKTKPGELNFISYKNPEVDRLIDEGRYTFDLEQRKKAYYRLQEVLREDAPYVFLYVPEELVAVASRFHGIKPAPAGITYNMETWYVPKSLQKYQITP